MMTQPKHIKLPKGTVIQFQGVDLVLEGEATVECRYGQRGLVKSALKFFHRDSLREPKSLLGLRPR